MYQTERKYIGNVCYLSLTSKAELVSADEKIHIPLSATEYKILSFFIDHANTAVYLDELAKYVWGINYGADQKDPESLKSHISRVRNKLEKIQTGLRNCLDTNFGFGSYTLKVNNPGKENNSGLGQEETILSISPEIGTSLSARLDCLPHIITKSSTYFADERDVLHRNCDIESLLQYLNGKKDTLLISGFGGIGKTAIARVLYSKLANKYDCVGWIEYNENLKTSILSAFDICDEIRNQEYRWRTISYLLKNSAQSILLFIDNVDGCPEKGQNPLADRLLYEISGYPNLSVVLTSRLSELRGYHTYHVNNLTMEDSEDLFYFYYNKNEYNLTSNLRSHRDTVRQLIELAENHTFAIELLAKSAKRALSLDLFANQIYDNGFKFPSLRITTNYKNLEMDAASQLRILFNLNSRSSSEQKVLCDFSVLPNMVFSYAEILEFLGYSDDDLYELVTEGWLTAHYDGIYMHPLIKEVIHIDYKDGKASPKTATKLIGLLKQEALFDEKDTFQALCRKFEIASQVVDLVPLEEDYAQVMQHLGRTAQKIGKISTAIEYFRKVLDAYKSEAPAPTDKRYAEVLANAYNDLGYQLSYTSNGRTEAEELLRKALKLRESLYFEAPNHYAGAYATTCDYLGYLLSDNSKTIFEGEELLRTALKIREKLAKEGLETYIHDAAWTRDNLGFLLSMAGKKYDEAEWHLREALRVRKELETDNNGEYLTEIAWTCRNLALLLQLKNDDLLEAETLYEEANKALHIVDKVMPGVHMADIAINENNMAVLLVANRLEGKKSQQHLLEAQTVFQTLNKEFPDLYSGEINAISHNLSIVDGILNGGEGFREDKQEIIYNMYVLSGSRIFQVTIK